MLGMLRRPRLLAVCLLLCPLVWLRTPSPTFCGVAVWGRSDVAAGSISDRRRLPGAALTARRAKEPQKITDLVGMKTREVKAFLDSKGIRTDDCFDPEALAERAIETEAQWGTGFTAGNPYSRGNPYSQTSAAGDSVSPEVEAAWQRLSDAWPAGEPLEFGPATATMSLIFLHGFADESARYMSDMLRPLMAGNSNLRVLLPQAPRESLHGQRIASWFLPTNGQWIVNDDVAKPTVAYLQAMIRREISRGVEPQRILIGGFAQGGGPAARAALSFPDAPLGGVVLLSHFFGAGAATVAPANKGLRALVCHGKDDKTVPFSEGERAVTVLGQLGADVTFKEYEMKHGVASLEIADIAVFLDGCAPPKPRSSAAAPATVSATGRADELGGSITAFDPLEGEDEDEDEYPASTGASAPSTEAPAYTPAPATTPMEEPMGFDPLADDRQTRPSKAQRVPFRDAFKPKPGFEFVD